MIATTDSEKNALRQAGAMLAEVLREVSARALPGVSAKALDEFAEREIRNRGAVPVFLGYESDDAKTPYPSALCVSINDEVVHSIPTAEKILADGDIVSLDLGLSLKSFVVDAALTVIVGRGDTDAGRLVAATREALAAGIVAARPSNTIGDIGAAIFAIAKKHGVSVVRDLGGHGTGKALHEPPFIANFGTAGQGEEILPGMVLALEPIFVLGQGAIKRGNDGWTYSTKDGSRAAHFEHTILVSEHATEILTRID